MPAYATLAGIRRHYACRLNSGVRPTARPRIQCPAQPRTKLLAPQASSRLASVTAWLLLVLVKTKHLPAPKIPLLFLSRFSRPFVLAAPLCVAKHLFSLGLATSLAVLLSALLCPSRVPVFRHHLSSDVPQDISAIAMPLRAASPSYSPAGAARPVSSSV